MRKSLRIAIIWKPFKKIINLLLVLDVKVALFPLFVNKMIHTIQTPMTKYMWIGSDTLTLLVWRLGNTRSDISVQDPQLSDIRNLIRWIGIRIFWRCFWPQCFWLCFWPRCFRCWFVWFPCRFIFAVHNNIDNDWAANNFVVMHQAVSLIEAKRWCLWILMNHGH